MKIRNMGILLSSVAMAVALTACTDNDPDAAKGDGASQSASDGKASDGKDTGKGDGDKGIAVGEKDPASGGGSNGGSNGSGGGSGSGDESTEACSNPDLKVTMTVQPGEQGVGVSTIQAKNTGSTPCHLPRVLDLQLTENEEELPVELDADPASDGLKLAPSASATAHLTYGLPDPDTDDVGSIVDSAQVEFNEVGSVAADLKDGIGMDGMVVMGSDFTLSGFEKD
ncbi:DUF4232 domain-containing protein [Streptomyces sp. NPDC047108]|uniref:DUF4232 domain-containing protein n=1 Tax=Streptomyces sp. NPDC047108 TaxID=3155025 RepID=UPI003409174E